MTTKTTKSLVADNMEFLYEEGQTCMNAGCEGHTKFIDGWLHCDTCKQHYVEIEDEA